MFQVTDVVKNLLIINVIVFFGTYLLPNDIKNLGMMFFYESSAFQPFQIITSMFMHADIGHLFFNMMALFFLGPYVERALGTKRFLILYLLSGLGASVAHIGVMAIDYYAILDQISKANLAQVIEEGRDLWLTGYNYSGPPEKAQLNALLNTPVLGASGSVYGVLIAFAAMFPNLKLMVFPIPIPIKAWILGIGLVVIGLISGLGGYQQGVAHFAHLGGAVTGFLLIVYWKKINLGR